MPNPLQGQLFLGAPQWGHSAWKGTFFRSDIKSHQQLSQYASYYSSVEGNTTFYAQPEVETFAKWAEQVPDGFRFCFKIPQHISHQANLAHCQEQMRTFIDLLQPIRLKGKLGQVMLQLPAQFGARRWHELNQFICDYTAELPLAIEVRHADFFAKGDVERELNRTLMSHQINRVMMDTRPVHSEPAINDAIIDAQKKKPKVPVHVLATGEQPIIRYVGQTNLAANQAFIQPWLAPIAKWLEQGKQPYLFVHTADNAAIHQLVKLWLSMLTEHLGYCPFADQPWPAELEALEQGQQDSLF